MEIDVAAHGSGGGTATLLLRGKAGCWASWSRRRTPQRRTSSPAWSRALCGGGAARSGVAAAGLRPAAADAGPGERATRARRRAAGRLDGRPGVHHPRPAARRPPGRGADVDGDAGRHGPGRGPEGHRGHRRRTHPPFRPAARRAGRRPDRDQGRLHRRVLPAPAAPAGVAAGRDAVAPAASAGDDHPAGVGRRRAGTGLTRSAATRSTTPSTAMCCTWRSWTRWATDCTPR